MAAVHLADAVGGNLFLGFISAVAFATILAVVAGLTWRALLRFPMTCTPVLSKTAKPMSGMN